MKKLFLFLLLLFCFDLSGQNGFVANVNIPDASPHPFFGPGLRKIAAKENGNLLGVVHNVVEAGGITAPLVVLEFGGEGFIADAFAVGAADAWLTYAIDYSYRAGVHALVGRAPGQGGGEMLLVVNRAAGTNWGRELGLTLAFSRVAILNESALVAYSEAYSTFSLCDLTTGNQMWSSVYRSADYPDSDDQGLRMAKDMCALPDNTLVVIGIDFVGGGILMSLTKLTNTGEVANSQGLLNTSLLTGELLFEELASDPSQDHFFLAGKILRDSTAGERGYTGFIAKLDANFQVLWSKELRAEAFPCRNISVASTPGGGVAFTYVTFGELPVIAGEISADGELLWRRGYSFYEPAVSIGRDGSFFFASSRKYFDDGSWETSPLVVKTAANGALPSCPQFSACLELLDFEPPLMPLRWTREVGPELRRREVRVAEANFLAADHCGTPPPPRPDFMLPDTVCQGLCLSPQGLQNRLAHAVEWRLEWPDGRDSTWSDTSFVFCFTEPGVYLVQQTIWLLGCAEAYERTVTVLPNNLGNLLGLSRVVCTAPPYTLTPTGARPLRSWAWDDGSTQPVRTVLVSGMYALTATDGYCQVEDTVQLTFLADTLQAPALVFGPTDTTLCTQHFPYPLRPRSAYASVFYLNSQPTPQAEWLLPGPGRYAVGLDALGCRLTDTLVLRRDPCPTRVYLPTAFSPNDDGLNDWFEPLGVDFLPLRLEVYDRWGGQLFRTEQPPFRWRGRDPAGLPAPPGTYLVTLRLLHTRTGQEETLSGEVQLLR